MRRKVVSSLAGISLLASLVVVPQATAGAQGTWNGFSPVEAPSILEGVNMGQPVPAWAAATTEDLGGAGTDIWSNNHAFRAEAMIDFDGSPFAGSYLAPPNIDTHGIVFTDLDGDGDEDVLETTARDNNTRILENNGGVLSMRMNTTGLEDFDGRGRQPLVIDYNGDGAMDILIPNLDRVPIDAIVATSELYLSDGNGTFTWTKVADPNEVIEDTDLNFAHQTRLSPGGDNVVFTSNNFTIALDSIQPGSSALVEAPTPIQPIQGAIKNATHIRDIALADLDGDLDPEYVVARQDNRLETDNVGAMDNMNNPIGDGVPDLVGLLPISMGDLNTGASVATAPVSTDPLADNCRAIALADYDNDADVDIFGGCTFTEGGQNRNIMLENDGLGNFTVTALPATVIDTAITAIATDLNNDGWMDTFVGGGYDNDPGKDFVYLNQGGTGHYLQIDLVGDNPDVAGAQVFVGTNKWQTRQTSHVGHQGQDTRTLHFGLAGETAIAAVEIVWPDGTIESCWTGGTVDTRITITKGQTDCETQTQAELTATLNGVPDTTAPPPPMNGPFCRGLQVTVQLSLGQTPTNGNDVILGTAGNDVINALDGDDHICGMDGDDTINGGNGKDRIYGDDGNDSLFGNDGRDVVQGGKGDDYIEGGPMIDRLSGNGGSDTMRGQDGKDQLRGNAGNDILYGGGGDDLILGNVGNDWIHGGTSVDTCSAESKRKCEL